MLHVSSKQGVCVANPQILKRETDHDSSLPEHPGTVPVSPQCTERTGCGIQRGILDFESTKYLGDFGKAEILEFLYQLAVPCEHIPFAWEEPVWHGVV